MINYSSFSIEQLLAVDEVLDYLTDMLDSDLEAAIVYREYRLAHQAVTTAINQQARDAAEHAGDPPELTVYVIPRKPIKIEPQDMKKFMDLYNAPAGDPPAVDAPPAEEPDDIRDVRYQLEREKAKGGKRYD